jgi:hypothetical protein
MSSKCDCKPGDEATGWQEVRCDVCKAKDRSVFARALEVAKKIVLDKR